MSLSSFFNGVGLVVLSALPVAIPSSVSWFTVVSMQSMSYSNLADGRDYLRCHQITSLLTWLLGMHPGKGPIKNQLFLRSVYQVH